MFKTIAAILVASVAAVNVESQPACSRYITVSVPNGKSMEQKLVTVDSQGYNECYYLNGTFEEAQACWARNAIQL